MNENEQQTELHNEMSVGEILRNARTTGRRKREIQTIAKQLCIREEFLQALEDGNYKAIPETVYILGFARNYAMELGLNPDEIIAKIKREMGLVSDENDDEDKENTDNSDAGAGADGEKWYRHIWGRSVKFVRNNWKWCLIGLVVILLIIGGIIGLTLQQTQTGINDAVQPETAVVSVNTTTEPKYNVDVRERFGTDNAENASVILQAIQESWVKVEDRRGNTVFSRVLVPGDVYYVPAGDGYTAVFGNAGGVDVWVNGVLAEKQGADHVRVADISLSPDDLLPETATVTE